MMVRWKLAQLFSKSMNMSLTSSKLSNLLLSPPPEEKDEEEQQKNPHNSKS